MHKVVVHDFNISSELDDPDIYAADPLWDWQQTEMGKWVMQHSKDTYWIRQVDPLKYNMQYKVVASFEEQDFIFFSLKWGAK